jgi:hypothetical protein
VLECAKHVLWLTSWMDHARPEVFGQIPVFLFADRLRAEPVAFTNSPLILIEALKRGFPDASGLPDESTLVDAVAATLQGVVPLPARAER